MTATHPIGTMRLTIALFLLFLCISYAHSLTIENVSVVEGVGESEESVAKEGEEQ